MIIAKPQYWLGNRAHPFGTRSYFPGVSRLIKNAPGISPGDSIASGSDSPVQEQQGLDEGTLIDLENTIELKLAPGSLWMALNH